MVKRFSYFGRDYTCIHFAIEFQKNSLFFCDLLRMHHGRSRAKDLVSESCKCAFLIFIEMTFFLTFVFFYFAVFVNYLPIKANQVFQVANCRHSLRWLYLLVLVAALPSNQSTPSLVNNWVFQYTLSQYFNQLDNSKTMWFIKWWSLTCDI